MNHAIKVKDSGTLVISVPNDVKVERVIVKNIGNSKEKTFCLERLPRINLNDMIKVKLTDHGKEIYYHRYDDINQSYGKIICKPDFPKVDKDGYTRFQLWQFMELYGRHIGMIHKNVIDPIEIVWMGE